MQISRFTLATAILLIASMLTGCGAAAATREPQLAAPAATSMANSFGDVQEAPAAPAAAPTEAAVYQTGSNTPSENVAYGNHMIIKNGDIKLLVNDTDHALDGATQVVADLHGYVVSSRVWYQDYFGTNYKYASLTIGVPVDQFENAVRRLRGLAVRVLDENATGEDVTNQFVDLKSQLTNLEATRDRIRGFLDDAKTVEEALQINQQLSEVEGQIEKIQGQMNYLSDRSAFSTIAISLEPYLPAITMTPTPTATPIPVQALGPWDPGRTAHKATNALVSAYRVIVEVLIWVLLVLLPIFGPPAVLIWLIVWLIRRRARSLAKA